MAKVELMGIQKSFGDIMIIPNLELTVESGEFVALVGPSGCGKSTLLRMIAGLEDPSGGKISIGGHVVNEVSPKDRGIAMVFQNYALYPHMSVKENLSFALKMAKLDKKEIAERVSEASSILGLKDLLERKPSQLSGGQKQRVAMGRAMVRQPKVLLFDEPLSNLDAQLRIKVRSEIALLHKRLRSTIIYVTHDQVEAMTLADRIAVLNKGNVEQYDAPLKIYHHPKTRFVASFIGTPPMNFVSTDIVSLSASHTAKIAGFRPEATFLNSKSDERVQIGKGKVTLIEPLGSTTHVHVKLQNTTVVSELSGEGYAIPKWDSETEIWVDPKKLFFFSENGMSIS
jgi:ABC-type sugar transport system ATPase subunit